MIVRAIIHRNVERTTVMSPLIQIKGVKEGLLVILGEGDWPELHQSLIELIDQKQEFLRGARVYLDVGSQVLHAVELGRLRDEVSERGISLWGVLSNTSVTEQTAQTLGLATRLSRQSEKTTSRSIAPASTAVQDGEPALLVQRTLRSGNSLKFDGHVVVIGDINPGAEVTAKGSIVIWGVLRGMVHAGFEGDERAIICALEMAPTQLRIGNSIWMAAKRSGKSQPGIAHLVDGQVVSEYWTPTKGKSGGLWPLR